MGVLFLLCFLLFFCCPFFAVGVLFLLFCLLPVRLPHRLDAVEILANLSINSAAIGDSPSNEHTIRDMIIKFTIRRLICPAHGDSGNKRSLQACLIPLLACCLTLPQVNPCFGQERSSSWTATNSFTLRGGAAPVLVRSTQTDSQEIILDYSLPSPTISPTGNTYRAKKVDRIDLSSAPKTARSGHPRMPVIPVRAAIPAGRTVDLAKISVLSSGHHSFNGSHFVEFSEGFYPLSQPQSPTPAEPDQSIYTASQPYPASRIEVVGKQYKHGHLIVYANLYPVSYSPKTGTVSWADRMTVHIPTEPEQKPLPYVVPKRASLAWVQDLQIENPQLIEHEAHLSASLRSERPMASGLCDPDADYQYVIVTSQEMANAATDLTIHDLIAHRQAKGLTATIVLVEDIFTTYPGADDAEKLRNFIIDAYTNWGTTHVLLGGDTNVVPMRKLWVQAWPGSQYIEQVPSDLYYQCLDGNYNFDGDDLWGEPTDGPDGEDVDLLSEVVIGRASAEDAEEMSNFIYKTLYYETAPSSARFLRNALMVGEYLGFGGIADYAKSSMEEIRLGSDLHGYVTSGFAQAPLFAVSTLYDQEGEWQKDAITSALNNDQLGIINHLGHANIDYVMKFRNPDGDALHNRDPLFAYSQGCLPGNFEADCIAEHLTTSNRSGMFAVVFNSRYGWGMQNSTDGPSQRFNRQFWDAFIEERLASLGAINADSHEDNLWAINDPCIRWCYYETNLLGDPAVNLRGLIDGPEITFDSSTAVDDGTGNGDRILNPGENVEINCSLTNIGTEESVAVTAAISSDDPYITITDSTADYGTIPSYGGTAQGLDNYQVTISADCPVPHTVDFDLAISDAQDNSWIHRFSAVVDDTQHISGNVSALTGSAPIQDATIVYSGPMSGEAYTDSAGTFTTNVVRGTYELQASADGYMASAAQSVTVPPEVSNIDFALKLPPILNLSPVEIAETVETGSTLCREISVRNQGDLELTFSGTISQTGNTAQTTSDLFGYTWTSSDDPEGPDYTWEDIRSTGTCVALARHDYEQVPLSFAFPYYENTYSALFINANGRISFNKGIDGYLVQHPIPHWAEPNNYISAYSDDWFDPSAGGSVCWYDDGSKFTVQFSNVPNLFSHELIFQTTLYANGNIELNYYNIGPATPYAAVGIENALGSDGLEIAFNYRGVELHDQLLIHIDRPRTLLTLNPPSGSVPPRDTVAVNACFNATELEPGPRTGIIFIHHDDPYRDTPADIPWAIDIVPVVDTDEDGLSDSVEARYGTDPHNPDTDADGLLDGQEDRNHNGVFDPGETDARDDDTDDDGYSDGYELAEFSDPLNPDSVPSFKPNLAAGSFHTVLARLDGATIAIGKNDKSQCHVETWRDVVHVAAGYQHTLGLRPDGTVLAAGDNSIGQCNVGTWDDIIRLAAGRDGSVGLKSDGMVVATRYDVSTWWGIRQIAAGYTIVAGLKYDGTVQVTGDTFSSDLTAIAQEVSTWTDIEHVAVGSDGHVVGLRKDGTVVAAGPNTYGQCDTAALSGIVQIAAGGRHTVALRSDGTTIAIGDNSEGQCDVGSWTEVVQLAAGDLHTAGLRSDGSLFGAGSNSYWQRNFKSWRDIVQIAGYGASTESVTIALLADGTVLAQGDNSYGLCDAESWQDIIQVAVGPFHALGLKSDGTVVAVGNPSGGITDVSSWTNIAYVAAGTSHSLGVKKDGTVVATGWCYQNECDVSSWTSIVQVDTGYMHSVGLQSDGTVLAVGYNWDGQCDVQTWSSISRVSAGNSHSVGLKTDGTVLAVGDNSVGQCNVDSWTDIVWVEALQDRTIGIKKDGTVLSTRSSDDFSDLQNVVQMSKNLVGLQGNGVPATNEDSVSWWNDLGQASLHDWDYSPAPYWPLRIAPENEAEAIPLDASFNWGASPNVTGYGLQVSRTPDFSALVVDEPEIADTFFEVADAFADNAVFYWRMRAQNEFGASTWSPAWTFTTTSQQPFSLILKKGLNLFAYPVQVAPEHGTCSALLSSIGTVSYTHL